MIGLLPFFVELSANFARLGVLPYWAIGPVFGDNHSFFQKEHGRDE
jgi:hypothetical protein